MIYLFLRTGWHLKNFIGLCLENMGLSTLLTETSPPKNSAMLFVRYVLHGFRLYLLARKFPHTCSLTPLSNSSTPPFAPLSIVLEMRSKFEINIQYTYRFSFVLLGCCLCEALQRLSNGFGICQPLNKRRKP